MADDLKIGILGMTQDLERLCRRAGVGEDEALIVGLAAVQPDRLKLLPNDRVKLMSSRSPADDSVATTTSSSSHVHFRNLMSVLIMTFLANSGALGINLAVHQLFRKKATPNNSLASACPSDRREVFVAGSDQL